LTRINTKFFLDRIYSDLPQRSLSLGLLTERTQRFYLFLLTADYADLTDKNQNNSVFLSKNTKKAFFFGHSEN